MTAAITLTPILLIGLLIVAAAAGYAAAAIMSEPIRARLESHIAAQRTTLRKAHRHLLAAQRTYGADNTQILKEIETTVTAVLQEETR